MKIGELAQQTGLAPSKIRFYEAQGLIGTVDRSLGGYRQYPARTKQVLELVILAQQAGFSLAEIRTLVAQQGKGPVGHDVMLSGLRKKLAEIEALQEKLAETHAGLRLVIDRIETTPPAAIASSARKGVLQDLRGNALRCRKDRDGIFLTPRWTPLMRV